jgi:hypothetical protein
MHIEISDNKGCPRYFSLYSNILLSLRVAPDLRRSAWLSGQPLLISLSYFFFLFFMEGENVCWG